MAHVIAQLIADRVSAGLKRKSLTTCSRWACACRVMGPPFPGPWTHKWHPWIREMEDSDAEMNIAQKSAQAGVSECVINRTFFTIDVKRVDCLYVLPAQTPDAGDFSSGRFNPALEMSPYLSKLFSDTQNVGHKRAGNTNLYIRGSRSRSGLKAIPVGLVVLDELDEMDQENIPLALERMAGQLEYQAWLLSTPTLPDEGINRYFQESSQESFFFKCPACSRHTTLTFPECLKITADDIRDSSINESHIICKECKSKLHHELKFEWLADGKWVPEFSDRPEKRGFYINQLYSSAKFCEPSKIAYSFLVAQRDPTEEQEFYNSKGGLTHVVAGAAVSDAQIEACKKDYRKFTEGHRPYGYLTMGIDVGKWLHYEVDQWLFSRQIQTTNVNIEATARVILQGKCLHFEELDILMQSFRIDFCVIDAHPERRKAFEFSMRFDGRIKLCFYAQGIQGKQIQINKEEENTISVDRTSWLDLSLGRFKNNTIQLPFDVDREYTDHIKAPVRSYEKNKEGQRIGRYISGSRDDHFAHARNYAELALPFAASFSASQNISENIV